MYACQRIFAVYQNILAIFGAKLLLYFGTRKKKLHFFAFFCFFPSFGLIFRLPDNFSCSSANFSGLSTIFSAYCQISVSRHPFFPFQHLHLLLLYSHLVFLNYSHFSFLFFSTPIHLFFTFLFFYNSFFLLLTEC